MLTIYTLFVNLAHIFLKANSPFSKQFHRYNNRPRKLPQILPKSKKRILIHCASHGEYNQAQSVAQKLAEYGFEIMISFFSDSGYSFVNKHPDPYVSQYLFLPIDLPQPCKSFLNEVNPDLVIFVKYEFWFNFINQLNLQSIPFIWISMLIKENTNLMKWPAKKLFSSISTGNHFFVQNKLTSAFLGQIGVSTNNITLAGDNRIESILNSPNKNIRHSGWEDNDKKVFIYGSVYLDDIQMIRNNIAAFPNYIHLVVPHKVDEYSILKFQTIHSKTSIFNSGQIDSPVVIVNKLGVLMSLYKYAHIAYIGGGFQSGIHNCLEALVHHVPCIIGPNHFGFQEINDLQHTEFIWKINAKSQLKDVIQKIKQSTESINDLNKYFNARSDNSSKIVAYVINELEGR